jgi:thioredoxin 1
MAHVNLSAENFEQEVLQSQLPVLVDFWAEWCGPCKMMGPIIDELSQELEDQNIKIAKCNVDDCTQLAEKYQVMSIPAFKVFSNGEVVDEWVGALNKDGLKEKLAKFLK